MSDNPKEKNSVFLAGLAADVRAREGSLPFGEVMALFEHRGFGFILLIAGIIGVFALPPLSTLAGTFQLIFAYQILRNYDYPHLPKMIARKQVSSKLVAMAMEKSLPLFRKFELLLRPRLLTLQTDTAWRMIGVMLVLFAVSVMIPLPFTNFLPSLAILLIGLGQMEKDGVAISIGLVIGIVGLLVTTLVLLLGAAFVHELYVQAIGLFH
jgi:hypothetical protein